MASRMTAAELTAHCHNLGLKTADLAAWEGTTVRAARRWRSGERPIPGALATLVRMCVVNPALVALARDASLGQDTAPKPVRSHPHAPHAHA